MLGMYTLGSYYMGEHNLWQRAIKKVDEAFHGGAVAGKGARSMMQELAPVAVMSRSGSNGTARQFVGGRSDTKRLRQSGRQTTHADILQMSDASAASRSDVKEAADKSLESRE